eukprot:TRINITY_DN7871_c0_g1_i1.p1 TRINITY_DN7871_c0_g1~~TRINITY_DN7871_c0_g1_i1.p1  ORF type:complete len:249 (+),score=12.34 TRINITY_DN7871_c0_g1_i1:80-826(+)
MISTHAVADTDGWSTTSDLPHSDADDLDTQTQQPPSYRYYKLYDPNASDLLDPPHPPEDPRVFSRQPLQNPTTPPTAASRHQRHGSNSSHAALSTVSYLSAAPSTASHATGTASVAARSTASSYQTGAPLPHASSANSRNAGPYVTGNYATMAATPTTTHHNSHHNTPHGLHINAPSSPAALSPPPLASPRGVQTKTCPRCEGVVEIGSLSPWAYVGCVLLFPFGLLFLTCKGEDRCPSCGWTASQRL